MVRTLSKRDSRFDRIEMCIRDRIPIPQDVLTFCDGNMENPVRDGVSADFVIEEEEEESL